MTAENRHERPSDLSDGEIIRYVDRECGPDEARRIAAHLNHCDACHERVELLQRRLGVLSSLLEEADFVESERRGLRPRFARRRLQVAATIIVTLGVGFSVTPVRAWVADALRGALARPNAAPSASLLTGPSGYGIVSFPVEGSTLAIELLAVPDGGRLHVQPSDRELASARIEGGDGSGEFLVLPGVLRIVGPAGSNAEYYLAIPTGVTRLSVRVGEAAPRYFDVSDLESASTRLIPLD